MVLVVYRSAGSCCNPFLCVGLDGDDNNGLLNNSPYSNFDEGKDGLATTRRLLHRRRVRTVLEFVDATPEAYVYVITVSVGHPDIMRRDPPALSTEELVRS